MKKAKSPLFVGIDVGTGSARAGVFDASGKLLGTCACPIRMWKDAPDFVEQSSDDIWKACCKALKEAFKRGKADPKQVRGIGFDATCSLVVLDEKGKPVTVSPKGRDEQNVVVWMDHRAIGQAARINAGKYEVLKYVGGVISPEMQTPKLLWLKENLPATWKRAAHFFDLPDYLTWRATGSFTRSLCSLVCKWTYLGHKGLEGQGWDKGYFEKIGLGDLAKEGFKRIGTRVRPMGEAIEGGVSAQAAKELGVPEGTPVGVSIIDAHSGGIGMLGASLGGRKVDKAQLQRRLALIGGTSSCHMAVSQKPRFVPGVWGPYFSAMVPGFWLTEGGQSAVGALIDHIIFSHPAMPALEKQAKKEGASVFDKLNAHVADLAKREGCAHVAELTKNFHINPDYHGNRSPRADPTLKGMVSGLSLDKSLDDLALQYLAVIQAVAYGTRDIIEHMNAEGYRIETIFACGGGSKNPLFLQTHADVTGCRLVLPKEPEAVLLGAAVLGAAASGMYDGLLPAMAAMSAAGRAIEPAGKDVQAYHARKFKVYQKMHEDYKTYLALMKPAVKRGTRKK